MEEGGGRRENEIPFTSCKVSLSLSLSLSLHTLTDEGQAPHLHFFHTHIWIQSLRCPRARVLPSIRHVLESESQTDTGTQAQRPAREDEDGRPERSRKRKSVDKKVCMPPVSCALSRDQCSDPIEDTASVDRRP